MSKKSKTERLDRHWKMKTEKEVTRKMKKMMADMQTKEKKMHRSFIGTHYNVLLRVILQNKLV